MRIKVLIFCTLFAFVLFALSSFCIYPSYERPDGISTREYALELSRSKNATPNTNFFYCADGRIWWKILTYWLKSHHDEEELYRDYHYHTCINTATGFYNPRYTAALCANFVKRPGRWHFHEIEKKDARPGDMIIMINNSGYPWHAVIIDQLSQGETYINHSNGKWGKDNYIHHDKLSRWRNKYSSLRYYTYDE